MEITTTNELVEKAMKIMQIGTGPTWKILKIDETGVYWEAHFSVGADFVTDEVFRPQVCVHAYSSHDDILALRDFKLKPDYSGSVQLAGHADLQEFFNLAFAMINGKDAE